MPTTPIAPAAQKLASDAKQAGLTATVNTYDRYVEVHITDAWDNSATVVWAKTNYITLATKSSVRFSYANIYIHGTHYTPTTVRKVRSLLNLP